MTEVTEKFDVRNRWTNEVQFTAEITCDANALPSVKLGLAVKLGVKAGAYLTGANLAGANLTGANLTGADLAGADLAGADLAEAKWRDGIVIQRQPIQISGLSPYAVTILDQHMQIGCELHSLADWETFDDRRIIEMDGRDAAKFWDAHKAGLMAIARGDGRSFEPVTQAVEAA